MNVLKGLRTRHVSIGDVRYIGLFTAIELVTNRDTKEVFSPAIMGEIGKTLRQYGLFTFIMANNMGSIIFIVPPLCITKDQLDEGLAIIEKTLEISDRQVKR